MAPQSQQGLQALAASLPSPCTSLLSHFRCWEASQHPAVAWAPCRREGDLVGQASSYPQQTVLVGGRCRQNTLCLTHHLQHSPETVPQDLTFPYFPWRNIGTESDPIWSTSAASSFTSLSFGSFSSPFNFLNLTWLDNLQYSSLLCTLRSPICVCETLPNPNVSALVCSLTAGVWGFVFWGKGKGARPPTEGKTNLFQPSQFLILKYDIWWKEWHL